MLCANVSFNRTLLNCKNSVNWWRNQPKKPWFVFPKKFKVKNTQLLLKWLYQILIPIAKLIKPMKKLKIVKNCSNLENLKHFKNRKKQRFGKISIILTFAFIGFIESSMNDLRCFHCSEFSNWILHWLISSNSEQISSFPCHFARMKF